MVNCSELKVTIRRNFQPNLFKSIEPIAIEAVYGGLLVSLSKFDYSFILELLQSFGEKHPNSDPDLPSLETSSNVKTTPKKNKKPNDLPVNKPSQGHEVENPLIDVSRLAVKLNIESIKMHLYDQESLKVWIL